MQGEKCKGNHGKKHCSALCCKVDKLGKHLNNIIQHLKGQSPDNPIRLVDPYQPYHNSPRQRPIPSQYLKVTETINRINGIEEIWMGKHHTDNSEMKKVLSWDDKQETERQRHEHNSRMIKLAFDRKKEKLESLRKKSQQKPWEKEFRSAGVYRDKQDCRNQKSPGFNNQYLKRQTGGKDSGGEFEFENGRTKNESKNTRTKQTLKRAGDAEYSYKRRVVTRYRSAEERSDTSTDSEFSRFGMEG